MTRDGSSRSRAERRLDGIRRTPRPLRVQGASGDDQEIRAARLSSGPLRTAGQFRRGFLMGAHLFAGMLGGVLLLAGLYAGVSQVQATIGHAQGGASSHAGHVIRQPFADGNGLVAWYPLDGNANDASGNGNNGTYAGNVTYGPGKFGQAYAPNGLATHMSAPVPAASYTGLAGFTWSVWVDPASTSSAQGVLSQSTSGHLNLIINGSAARYELGTSPTTDIYSAAGSVRAGSWTLLTAAYDPSLGSNQMSLYVNGALAGSATPTSFPTFNSSLATYYASYSYSGYIDDVRVFDRALSASEISQLYQGSQPANCDQTCVGWWKLDGTGSSTTAIDSSGNANTGTLTNFSFDGTTNGWVSGVFNGALQFKGSSDYIALGTSSAYDFSRSSGRTFMAWINPTSTGARHVIIAKQLESTAPYTGWEMELNASNRIYFSYIFQWSSNADAATTVSPVPTNQWTHIAVTYKAGVIGIYVNGVPQATTGFDNISSDVSTSLPAEIGASSEQAYAFAGYLDDVRIYSRALAPYEIYEQYSSGRS